jgi:hypothetical protein
MRSGWSKPASDAKDESDQHGDVVIGKDSGMTVNTVPIPPAWPLNNRRAGFPLRRFDFP